MIKLGTVKDFRDAVEKVKATKMVYRVIKSDLLMSIQLDVIDESLESADANWVAVLTCARLNKTTWTFNYSGKFWNED